MAKRKDYQAVRDRDGYICWFCGGKCTDKDSNIHHVIPLSRGGKTVMENLRCVHILCHRAHHKSEAVHKSIEEFSKAKPRKKGKRKHRK